MSYIGALQVGGIMIGALFVIAGAIALPLWEFLETRGRDRRGEQPAGDKTGDAAPTLGDPTAADERSTAAACGR